VITPEHSSQEKLHKRQHQESSISKTTFLPEKKSKASAMMDNSVAQHLMKYSVWFCFCSVWWCYPVDRQTVWNVQ